MYVPTLGFETENIILPSRLARFEEVGVRTVRNDLFIFSALHADSVVGNSYDRASCNAPISSYTYIDVYLKPRWLKTSRCDLCCDGRSLLEDAMNDAMRSCAGCVLAIVTALKH